MASSDPTWSPAPTGAGGALRRLVVGERVRSCSATLVPELSHPKTVTVPVRDSAERIVGERTFEAQTAGARIQVSPCAFVERVS